jgi:hypothetical protein
MIRKIVLFALVALLVAFGVVLLLRPAPPPQRLAITPLESSRIERIEVAGDRIADGTATRAAPGEWVITLDDGGATWPASTPAIRSALRALAEIASLEPSPLAEFVPAATLVVHDDAGDRRRFEFAPAVIGGRRAVTIDASATVSAPVGLTDAVIQSGPAAWRDPFAFPGAGANVTRVLIEQAAKQTEPARRLEIRRAAGRWLIASPVTARGSQKAVDAAIARLAGAKIERFIDEPVERELTGLDDPVFTITITSGNDPATVRFGARATASGLERFAEAAHSDAVFVVDTTLLADLSLDPAAYTDRRSTPVPPADVYTIAIELDDAATGASAERTLDGWTGSSDRFEPARLVELLTSGAGATVAFVAPEGWNPVATIRLEDLAGDPLDVLIAGVGDEGRLRVASRVPGAEPVFYSIPGLTLGVLGLPDESSAP